MNIVKTSVRPQEASHTLRLDIVNKDASAKRVEIEFCKTDHWSECWPGTLNIAEMLGEGLHQMIAADKHSVGSKCTIMDNVTCKPIEVINFIPVINKPEFLTNEFK